MEEDENEGSGDSIFEIPDDGINDDNMYRGHTFFDGSAEAGSYATAVPE